MRKLKKEKYDKRLEVGCAKKESYSPTMHPDAYGTAL